MILHGDPCSANGIIRVDDSPASRGSNSAATAARCVKSCTTRIPSRSFDATVLPSWARTDHLTCVRAAGDSMEPTIRDGDLVVVDQASGGSRGASAAPRSAAPNCIPMTEAIDCRVVYRAARP